MGDSTDDPDDGEILEAAITTMLAGMHTSMPARIISYTHGVRPRATVRPVVRFSFMDPDTEERVTELPESVANVPVFFGFGSGGDYSDTWPLQAGDPVYLFVAERSTDEWLATNANDNAPQDKRRFDLTDAVALPVLGAGQLASDAFHASARVIKAPLTKIGSASAFDPVSLSSLVLAEHTTIAGLLAAVSAQLIVLGQAGIPPYVPGSTGASKLQAE